MKHMSLMTSVNKLEDSIITISGPALAISGIIAGVDLVTGGNILRSVSWLALVWAICLLLTLDFQVLALGARTHRVYLSNKTWKQKTCEILLAVLIAAAISYVSIQMQSVIARANSATPMLSIDVATAQMGINPIALIWERSALVLVLIFLSGWFRDLSEHPDHQPEQPTSNPQADAVQTLLERVEQLTVTVTQITATATQTVSQTHIQPLELPERTEANAATVEGEQSEQGTNTEQLIRIALASNPLITDRRLAEIVRIAPSTANKYRKRIEQDEQA